MKGVSLALKVTQANAARRGRRELKGLQGQLVLLVQVHQQRRKSRRHHLGLEHRDLVNPSGTASRVFGPFASELSKVASAIHEWIGLVAYRVLGRIGNFSRCDGVRRRTNLGRKTPRWQSDACQPFLERSATFLWLWPSATSGLIIDGEAIVQNGVSSMVRTCGNNPLSERGANLQALIGTDAESRIQFSEEFNSDGGDFERGLEA